MSANIVSTNVSAVGNQNLFDYVVFIGRFEPFHLGHRAVVAHALTQGKQVIVLIGSALRPRTITNPWSVAERTQMIHEAFSPSEAARIRCVGLPDSMYNDEQWATTVQRLVLDVLTQDKVDSARAKIALIGHTKDASSYYLGMFPQWQRLEVENFAGFSATAVREALFESAVPAEEVPQFVWHKLEALLPLPVLKFLQTFSKTAAFAQLVREFHFIRQYKAAWAAAPYAPTFVTVDAVLVHSAHILLVKRRAEPGRGLWALPGGFLDQNERIVEACIRELREETRLKIPSPVLRGSIKGQQVFDHPQRSLRGRTITHAIFFEFPLGDLPAVKGADDAEKAQWVPLSAFREMREQMYEDHFDIVTYFLGV